MIERLCCTECKKNIIPDIAYVDWLKLVHFIEFLYYEDCITPKSYEEMMNCLMTLKPMWEENHESS